MSNDKMITIADVLEEMDEEIRENVTKETENCLKAVCCEEMKWKEFLIYKNVKHIMAYILENRPEFIMGIADYVRSEMENIETVRISIFKGKETNISFFKVNKTTTIGIISFTPKEWWKIVKK